MNTTDFINEDEEPVEVASYTRFSSEGQNETSIEYQDSGIEQYCKRMGYVIVEKYSDKAFSATNDRRPDFRRMIHDAGNKPRWKKLIVYDFSRFSRNTSDAFKYRDYLYDNGIKIISSTMPFDDNSPETLLMEGIMFMFNDYFSRKLANVTRDGLAVKAKKGGHCGGRPPLGYDVQGDDLIVNEEEAKIVKAIFEMYMKGVSYADMAKLLNQEHKRTKAGAEFKKNSFQSILTQEKYTGTYIWNRSRERDSKSRRNPHAEKPLDQQVRIPNHYEPIIDKAVFDKVQSVMKSRKGKRKGSSKHHYMLNNLDVLKCASCGEIMTGSSKKSHGKTTLYYACPNHRNHGCSVKDIPCDGIDRLILELVVDRLLGDKKMIDRYNELLKNADEDEIIENKLNGINRAIENILGVIEENNSEQAQARLKRLQAHKKELMQKSMIGIKGLSDNPEDFLRQKKELVKLLRNSDNTEVRNFLSDVIDSVIVGNDKVKIELKI